MADDTAPDRSLPAQRPVVLRGTSVAPGLAMGQAYPKEYDLAAVNARRVPRDRVEGELNRFHASLGDSRAQLEELKGTLRGKVPEDHVRILDTHLAYLKDSVFLSDVENLILGEQMSLEGAIAKVILDFDRIFRLVKSETLRERAVDLRDVGIRVLRNLERQGQPEAQEKTPIGDHILVARELSIVDMFNLAGERVLGILTEGGSMTSHAAILARSMHIPTLTGVDGLLDQVRAGDFVIIDATEGVVRVRPDELVRAQYREAHAEAQQVQRNTSEEWERKPAMTADGESIQIAATCGNLPEVDRARDLGMSGVGLYRTELLYLIDREPPSLESLVAHYRAVFESAGVEPVTFRLVDLDSSTEVGFLFEGREQNPGLGRMGIRALLAHEPVLRRQLSAILQAGTSARGQVRVAVPKVLDPGELRRVKELLYEERYALKRGRIECSEDIELGAVLETPASALGVHGLAAESDFLVVNLNSLQQYLLAADRDNANLASTFERMHPIVVRTLRDIVRACSETQKPLSIFGVTAVARENLPFLLGVGLRRFAVAPVNLKGFIENVRQIDLADAVAHTEAAARASSLADLDPVIGGFGHGLVSS